jgi:hypothetical protein
MGRTQDLPLPRVHLSKASWHLLRRAVAFGALVCPSLLLTTVTAAEFDHGQKQRLGTSESVASESRQQAIPARDGSLRAWVHPAPAQTSASPAQLSIRVANEGWGGADLHMIHSVLHAVAEELVSKFPGRSLAPIIVSRSTTSPVTLYERGPEGEYFIRLTASGNNPAAYVYEFAHELCHVLANYQRHQHDDLTRRHQWFEEAVCEAASLYMLKTLAIAWQREAPNPQFTAAASHMQLAADRFFSETHRRLPAGMTLAAWYEQSSGLLTRTAYDRRRNEVVANMLLPLFEESPWVWEAVGFLNLGQPPKRFQDYLQNWHEAVPPHCREVIRHVMAMFFEPVGRLAGALDPRPVMAATSGFGVSDVMSSTVAPPAQAFKGVTGSRFTAPAGDARTTRPAAE